MHKWISFPHREGCVLNKRMPIFPKRQFMSERRAEVDSSALPLIFIINMPQQVGRSGRAIYVLALLILRWWKKPAR